MSQPIATASRILAAVVALCVGGLLFLIALLGFIPGIMTSYDQMWNGSADISTPKFPFIDSWDEIDKDYAASFPSFIFASPEPLAQSRLLTATETGIDSLVALTGSLLIVLIAIRVLMRRSFSQLARWGLIVFGLLIIVDATLGPQLAPLASDIALQELDYPILSREGSGMMSENSPDMAYLALWDPIWVANRFDFTLLMLGIVVLLFGALVRDGVKLQKDTEGLV